MSMLENTATAIPLAPNPKPKAIRNITHWAWHQFFAFLSELPRDDRIVSIEFLVVPRSLLRYHTLTSLEIDAVEAVSRCLYHEIDTFFRTRRIYAQHVVDSFDNIEFKFRISSKTPTVSLPTKCDANCFILYLLIRSIRILQAVLGKHRYTYMLDQIHRKSYTDDIKKPREQRIFLSNEEKLIQRVYQHAKHRTKWNDPRTWGWFHLIMNTGDEMRPTLMMYTLRKALVKDLVMLSELHALDPEWICQELERTAPETQDWKMKYSRRDYIGLGVVGIGLTMVLGTMATLVVGVVW